MDRTGNYYRTVTNHRTQLKSIWETYNSTIANLEQHRGSRFYEEQTKQAAAERDEAIQEAQRKTAESFSQIIGAMREAAMNRPMAAPTNEQLGLLHALKLRETISRDELLQASRTLDNPACLAVLQELATKNGFLGMRFEKESTDSILQHIDSLDEAAKKTLRLTKPDSRREQISHASIHSPTYQAGATELLLVDRDFDSEDSMLRFFGNIDSIEQFREAVNA